MRCLLIDDSPRYLRAARALLEREGIAVVGVARTGEEALAQVAELQPDVTLIDINLGDESGIDLARRLNEAGQSAGPGEEGGIILISSHSVDDFAELVEASPVLGFLDKSALGAGAIESLLHGGQPAGGARA
ncbi:response regulator [Actinopolymorpha pittospori]